MAISVPANMANPTSDFDKAGASFVPSPVTATTFFKERRPNNTIIHEDNLIKVLKDFYPYFKLTNTQWKMIVEIGDKDTQGFINFDTFIKLVENCARREEMPRMK